MRKKMKQANQYKPDPRQTLFLSYYLDPKSETFSVAYQSAIKAHYKKEYAESLTALMPKWLSEIIGDNYLIKKAEGNLKDFLEMDITNTGTTKSGEIYEYDDTGKLKVKADVSKFILERLNKKKYSLKTELEVGLEEQTIAKMEDLMRALAKTKK